MSYLLVSLGSSYHEKDFWFFHCFFNLNFEVKIFLLIVVILPAFSTMESQIGSAKLPYTNVHFALCFDYDLEFFIAIAKASSSAYSRQIALLMHSTIVNAIITWGFLPHLT